MTPRAKLALATFALLAIVAFVYAPVKKGVFIWDDHALVETNPVVREGTLSEIFRQPFWTADPMIDVRPPYYRPLSMLSFRTDYAFASEDPHAFHVTNLALHLLAVMALVVAARRLGASILQSLVAAGVWALHPRLTESVAWVSGRTDVLATLFVLVGIAAWPWYGGDRENGARAPLFAHVRAAVAGIAVALGLLSKEVAVAGALAITAGTILGASPLGEKRAVVLTKRLAHLALPLAGYAALRLSVTSGITSKAAPLGAGERAATFLEAVGRYVEMTLDGWHPATSIGLVGEIDMARAGLGAFVLVFALALLARAMARRRASIRPVVEPPVSPRTTATIVGAVLALVSIGLVVHVIPLLLSAGVTADRLLYMPLAGLALTLAVAVGRLPARSRRLAGCIAFVVAATFGTVTRARAEDYTDELRFRVVAAEHSHPHNTGAKSGLANTLRAAGELELACRLHESVRRTLQAPDRAGTIRHVRALENLGGCYEVLGRYESAAGVYAELLAMRPDSARVHMEIGYLKLHVLDIDGAEKELRRAIEIEPTLTPARVALGTLPAVRASIKRLEADEARLSDRLGWAQLLTSIGRVPDAIQVWRIIALDPDAPDPIAWDAAMFLVVNADIATARTGVDAYRRRKRWLLSYVIDERMAAREAKQKRLDALRARIEALAAP